jgi:hypothetical protein
LAFVLLLQQRDQQQRNKRGNKKSPHGPGDIQEAGHDVDRKSDVQQQHERYGDRARHGGKGDMRAAMSDPTRRKIAAAREDRKKGEVVHQRRADRDHQKGERGATRTAKLAQRHPPPDRRQIRIGSEQDRNDPGADFGQIDRVVESTFAAASVRALLIRAARRG